MGNKTYFGKSKHASLNVRVSRNTGGPRENIQDEKRSTSGLTDKYTEHDASSTCMDVLGGAWDCRVHETEEMLDAR